jgi:hypothetical protein
MISVLHSRAWVANGVLFVAGEVRNTSAYRVGAWVTVRIAPGHNNPTDTLAEPVAFDMLPPGGRSPFLIRRSPFAPSSTSIVEITAGGGVVGNPAAAIGVSNVGSFGSDPDPVGGTGDGVRVQVRNVTDRPIQLVRLSAGFRGADGKITNVGFRDVSDVVITPGDVYESLATAEPSGKLAVSADVGVSAHFADFPYEPVVPWHDWFHDVGNSSLKSSIAWLAERGITSGCAPYRFCPTANVTRAQMALFLTRAIEPPLPTTTTDYFDDDDGKTGEAAINRLAAAKITGGCAPRRFCPTAYVTRAQMALFLDRAWDFPSTTTDYFDDDDGKTGEAAINRLAAAKITGGCGTRRYCPSAYVTRAQMAAFLKRVLD